jgi:hypothetical protein
VRDYSSSDAKVVGRIEMVDERFRAIKPDDSVAGEFDSLSAARNVLLPQPVKRKTAITSF